MASYLARILQNRVIIKAIFSLPIRFYQTPFILNNFNKAYKADWKSPYFLKLTHQERGLEVQWFLKLQPKVACNGLKVMSLYFLFASLAS